MLLFIALTLFCLIALAVRREDGEGVAARRTSEVTIIPTESFNLKVLRRKAGDRIDVAPAGVNHQWFAANFANLPVDRETAIRVCMEGNDIGINIADCRKWVGLRPLMTYADPTQYESYQWYRRDAQGRWVSGDLFARGAAKYAGAGRVPEQQVMPAHLAEQFLTNDGAVWHPWREMAEGEVDIAARTFTVRERFEQPRAAMALHIPYTFAYQEAFLQRLRAARLPGVAVDEIGRSAKGRKLYMVRVDDPEHPTPLRLGEASAHSAGTRAPLVKIEDPPDAVKPRVMLVVAREHGSEHPSGWVLQGLLRKLLDNTAEARRLREGTTWLLLPMYDPDGVANSVFHAITDRFFPHNNHPVYGSVTPPEVIAYARYLRAFVNSGRMLATVSSFYGLECNEGMPVVCPHVIKQEKELLLDFNEFWFTRLRQDGVLTNDPRRPWHEGWVPHRLHGWCWYWYGAFTAVFQLGDRFPDCRLGLCELEALGAGYATTVADWLETPQGRQRLEQTRQFLQQRAKERDLWFRTSMAGNPDDPTLYDMLSMGY